jgi:tRNA wybutosine-synthesizing protein 1
VDVEDLGAAIRAAADEKEAAAGGAAGAAAREMVTPMQRKALTKEGYKILGSHSAVKLCRWTKAQLRGRG